MFLPTVKFLLKFDDDSLYENISNVFLGVNGNDSVDIVPNGLGYVMKQDQYLTADTIHTNISQNMILGFLLYPVHPGVVIDPVTDGITGIEMPIIDLVTNGKIDNSVITVTETTNEDGTNFLTVRLNNRNYSQSTSPYTVAVWHHFWIVYDNSGSIEKLDIYIDGTLQDTIDERGNIPGNINGNVVDVYINQHLDGYAYNKTNNYGYLDDIVIFNTDERAEEKCQRMINYSVDHIVDDNFLYLFEKDYGVTYEDPSTLRINSLIDDMSFVYVSRNDGKILRGSPLFWEARKIFFNENEKELLEENIVGDTGVESEVVNGFLKITNSMVRI